MANLDVQPKKKSILPWLLLAAGIIALIIFLAKGCNDNDEAVTTTSDTTVVASTTGAQDNLNRTDDEWNDLDWNAPAANWEEMTDNEIRGSESDRYAYYSLGEDILFDLDKSDLRSGAEARLKLVAGSISKRFPQSNIRLYGFTDKQGPAEYNKELSEKRAETVKNWMTNNGVDANRISVNAMGEKDPEATNATAAGRQQNRRVEIVVRKAS